MMLLKIRLFSVLVIASSLLAGCQTIDLYEKTAPIPRHEWSSSFKPQFQFDIEDTTANYDIYIVIRHTGKYNWNNIWLSVSTQVPGDSATRQTKYELPLASNDGWLGTAMDDIYEHRVRITPKEGVAFKKGSYRFTLQQIMREDPLLHVMNAGIRVEKKI